MKALLIQILLCTSVFSVSYSDIVEDLTNHFKNGNSKEISKYFSEQVDIKILDKEDLYSKAQGELILKGFFQKNAPQSFSVIHSGVSKNGAKFAVGSLKTKTGNFKTYFLLKKDGNNYLLQQLRIEPEN